MEGIISVEYSLNKCKFAYKLNIYRPLELNFDMVNVGDCVTMHVFHVGNWVTMRVFHVCNWVTMHVFHVGNWVTMHVLHVRASGDF
jgi:hypothetical protein